jgi:SOS-response transcriptional repressor LexA/DNA-binding transcriptional regulator YiaG
MNTPLSKVRTGAYAGSDVGDHIAESGPKNGKAMPKSESKSGIPPKPEWATTISELRQRLNLSQTAFGQRLHSSAMGISRWERGTHEPPAGIYIELGILAGDPLCWYFWGRAGLRNEDFIRVLPKLKKSMKRTNVINFQIANAGGGHKRPKVAQLVAVPLVKVVAASHGENGDSVPTLHDAPVESMIAAPKAWCPNPAATTCLRVKGNSMNPLLYDGYILVVDSSQNDGSKLDGKIVIAWHKDKGLTVSRLQAYDHTEVLRAENSAYESVVLNKKHSWKIVAKVLWWIGKAP